ncbi:MarR family transcriptional regulator [Nocardioides sp.]|uniref:MarR family transcriptional regulator n=1 Tax=Nocardioides sp. TaxID=35761 RepID=UPI001A3013CA|nr:MarR family transcriptional regulator [Nocardioides sp.]MBJ7358965.1 MarR family transcriptional regulator [Nocardioides sp.]
MQVAPLGHDENVIGAAALLVADRMRQAVEPLAGTSGASAAALTALLAWADGAPVDALAAGLRLSHSRAVRVVDALEREGLAVRGPDRTDGRRALVHLTKQGRAAAARVLDARAGAVREVLASLDADGRRALAAAAEAILEDAADSRAEARAICRLCDAVACGHPTGGCPATAGADSRERP